MLGPAVNSKLVRNDRKVPWERMDVSRENRLLFVKIPLISPLGATPYKRKEWGFLVCSCLFQCYTQSFHILFRNYHVDINWEEVWWVFWLLGTGQHTRCDLRLLPVAWLRCSHTALSGTYIFSRSPNPGNAPFGMTWRLVRTSRLKREWT